MLFVAVTAVVLFSQFAGVMVGLLLAILPKVLFYLPSAVLSSMVIIAVGGLIDVKSAKRLWRQDRQDFLVRCRPTSCTGGPSLPCAFDSCRDV